MSNIFNYSLYSLRNILKIKISELENPKIFNCEQLHNFIYLSKFVNS